MSVDLPGLLVGLGLFALFGLWILSDWRVRSARSVALLLAGLAVVAFVSLAFDSIALRLLGISIGVAFMTPVILIHPLVMPLAGPDAEMSEHIAVAQRKLVRAGQRFKRKQRSQSEYVADLEAIRRQLRRFEAPIATGLTSSDGSTRSSQALSPAPPAEVGMRASGRSAKPSNANTEP